MVTFLRRKKKIPFNYWDGIPVFAQLTIYHVRTEIRLSLGKLCVWCVCVCVCVIRHHHTKVSSCSLNPTCDILVPPCISTAVMIPYQTAKMLH